MRICRFDDNRIGVVTDDGIHDVTQAALGELPTVDLSFASLRPVYCQSSETAAGA